MPSLNTQQNTRKDDILIAATRVFLQDGYSAANVDTIASHAGVSKPTVYKHFDSKTTLFNAMVNEITIYNNIIDVEELKQLSPTEGLTKYAHSIIECLYRQDMVSLYRLVIAESKQFPEMKNALSICCCNSCHAPCNILISHYKEQGLFDIEYVGEIATQFFTLLEEPILSILVMRRSELPDIKERESIINKTVRTIVSTYSK